MIAVTENATPHHTDLLERLERLQGLVDGTVAPASAHLRISTMGRVRDVLLGSTPAPAARPPVVAWETAPLAEVFFDTREGDEYELDLGERVLEGKVLERNLLRLEDGALKEVLTESMRCLHTEDGWKIEPRPQVLLPRPGDRKPRKVELDAAQQAIVDLPHRTPVVVLGEAGAGKTTVAVHRIQRLLTEKPKWKAGVIVPTEPLRHRIESMLGKLGLGDRVKVYDFDHWAGIEARRVFPNLPPKDSRDAPAGVVRIKRDPALRVAMRALVERWSKGKRGVRRSDLNDLFGDRKLLELVAAHADPLIPIPQIAEVLEHNRTLFSSIEEELDVDDPDRLSGIDGRGIDEDTDVGTLDPEDPPVLFALDRMRAERGGPPAAKPRRFDVLFVDEAQELAPFELELLGQAHRGSLIVAGDAGQQVDPTACFRGWDATVADLDAADAPISELKIGYRCPPPIADFAQEIVSGGKAAASDAVRLIPHGHESHLISWIADEVRALRREDPAVTIGIIARDAARLSTLLERSLPIVGSEELRPGATHVVSVLAAKGLEFDTVIVADADPRSFPDTPESRRGLYVAITRATHQLVLTWSGDASPLIQP